MYGTRIKIEEKLASRFGLLGKSGDVKVTVVGKVVVVRIPVLIVCSKLWSMSVSCGVESSLSPRCRDSSIILFNWGLGCSISYSVKSSFGPSGCFGYSMVDGLYHNVD